jgi:uncharacterized membrane protein
MSAAAFLELLGGVMLAVVSLEFLVTACVALGRACRSTRISTTNRGE